jgi:structural maintenance of chromosome 2
MFIQEVVIEGFKSYGQKTVVSNFDPQFNAITGLNGTGKSNILDAICFNLGITNLSQVIILSFYTLIVIVHKWWEHLVIATFHVIMECNSHVQYKFTCVLPFRLSLIISRKVRAGSMQDLIYKQGQAGITKASVTVTFNNADTANSPVGYESHKQITVSRQVRTSYYIF